WADDVAYSVHDLEDGFYAGLITFKNLRSSAERSLVTKPPATPYCEDGVSLAELDEVLDDLLALDVWPAAYDGGPETAAALKSLTSELIGRFCVAAPPAAAGMRAAEGDHGSLRDDACGCARGAGPGAGTADRAGLRRRARGPADARPAAAPRLGRGAGRRGPPPGHHRSDRLPHRHVRYCLASPPLRARRVGAWGHALFCDRGRRPGRG